MALEHKNHGIQLAGITISDVQYFNHVQFDDASSVDVNHDSVTFGKILKSPFLAFLSDLSQRGMNNLRVCSGLDDSLLLVARYGKEEEPEKVIAKISQETLAEMISTTRSRVSFFMNKLRKLGYIKYNGGLQISSSLLRVVLREPQFAGRLSRVPTFRLRHSRDTQGLEFLFGHPAIIAHGTRL